MPAVQPRRRPGTPHRRLALPALAFVLLTASGWFISTGAADDTPGQRLFEGRAALSARIQGHEDELPAQAWRCANCHAGEQAIGGALDRERLLAHQPRRGGPPSRYELQDFCRLLRTGVDPAWILIDHSMPRFDIDDRQCQHLWHRLTRS